MMQKEAKARIKINALLQEAGWRFFDNDQGLATFGILSEVTPEGKANMNS